MKLLGDLVLILSYGALGAVLMHYMVEGWRFLAAQGGFQTEPLRRRDDVVIGALIALQLALGKLLQ